MKFLTFKSATAWINCGINSTIGRSLEGILSLFAIVNGFNFHLIKTEISFKFWVGLFCLHFVEKVVNKKKLQLINSYFDNTDLKLN